MAGRRDWTSAPRRFSITWGKNPQGGNLAYTMTIACVGPSQKILTGSLTCALNKAAALVAVGFSLTGPDHARYEVTGHVMFADTGRKAIVAEQMIFGPSGSEPLFALQISMTPKTEINALGHTSPKERSSTTQTDSNTSRSCHCHPWFTGHSRLQRHCGCSARRRLTLRAVASLNAPNRTAGDNLKRSFSRSEG